IVMVFCVIAAFWASAGTCRGQDTAAQQSEVEPAAAPQELNPLPDADETMLVKVLQEQPRQLRYWTTNWSFRDINIGTLARRLSRIGITAPVELDGNVTIEFAVSIPINALRDATAYRIVGTLESPRLRVESTTLSLNTGVNYENGVVSLSDLRG